MRCFLVVALALAAWSPSAYATGPYGDEDRPYEDVSPFFGEPVPEPPPPPPAAPAETSPYQLLPDVRPGTTRPPVTEPSAQDPYHLLPDSGATPGSQPPRAALERWRYAGPHAIPAEHGGGFCSTRGPHDHPYPPFDDHLFQESDEGFHFLGDPVDFGYSGTVFWFGGPHPIARGWGIGWCHIPWPHRHLYPPFSSSFSACGPYWCYVGPFDDWYWYWRPFYFGFYAYWYPRYYLGGTYVRTGVPARHGHGGAVASGHGRGHGAGRPAGRPGGYARPLAARPLVRSPSTLYHRLPQENLGPRPRQWRDGPRSVPWRAPSPPPGRGWQGPYHRMEAGPRTGTPAPRLGAPAPAPRFGAPASAPAPRLGAPPRVPAPAGPRTFRPAPPAPAPRAPSPAPRTGGFRR